MYIKPEYDALIEPEKVLITPGQLFRTVWGVFKQHGRIGIIHKLH